MGIIDLTVGTKAKSDQLNADDIIVGSMTIEVTSVKVVRSDQPIIIDYVGANGKPYKPCKSMVRVLVGLWGKDGANYIGRKITLYNDPDVMFGGKKVGGLRIYGMSHIEKDSTVLLTVARNKKAPYLVKKLVIESVGNQVSDEEYKAFSGRLENALTLAELQIIATDLTNCNYDPESASGLMEAFTVAKIRINNIKKEG